MPAVPRLVVRTPGAWVLAVALTLLGVNGLAGAAPAHARAGVRADSAALAGGGHCHEAAPAHEASLPSAPAMPDCCSEERCPCTGAAGLPAPAAAARRVGRAPLAAAAAIRPAAPVHPHPLLRPPIVDVS